MRERRAFLCVDKSKARAFLCVDNFCIHNPSRDSLCVKGATGIMTF